MQTLSNQQNIGDMFLAYIKEASPELGAKWGAKWSEVPEKYACAQEIFAHLATYMVNEYVSPQTSRHWRSSARMRCGRGCCSRTRSASSASRRRRPRCARAAAARR